MTTAIDLFAGLGGWSTGARAAGVEVLWAANHWPVAVEWHSANHPDTIHVCQDLHQAQWDQVPAHDILLASPCCQGHSKARGQANGNPQHDASRSTAWAVVSALELHRPGVALVENVPEFADWALYPAWTAAVQALGYQVAPHIVDCADLGVPQHRVRLFLVLTRSKAPLMLELHRRQHVAAASFLDFSAGKWSSVEKPGRALATLQRVANGRARFGDQSSCLTTGKGLASQAATPVARSEQSPRWIAGLWCAAMRCECSVLMRPWPPCPFPPARCGRRITDRPCTWPAMQFPRSLVNA